MVGYIEEEDDLETDRSDEDEDGGWGSSGADLGFLNRSSLRTGRISSLSGSDSDGNDRYGSSRTSRISRRSTHKSLGGEKSSRSVRLASWSGPASSGGAVSKKSFEGGRRSSSYRPRGRRTGSGSDGSGSGSDSYAVDEQRKSSNSDGSTEGDRRRKFGVSKGKTKKAPGSVLPVGPAVRLSVQAAAIVNTKSPTSTGPELPTTGQNEMEGGTDAVPSVPVDTSKTELSPAMPVSSMPDRSRRRSSASSISQNRPVELDHSVETNITPAFNPKVKVHHWLSTFRWRVGRRENRACLKRHKRFFVVVCPLAYGDYQESSKQL